MIRRCADEFLILSLAIVNMTRRAYLITYYKTKEWTI